MSKIKLTALYSNPTDKNDFQKKIFSQNNLSYCHKDKKDREINVNLIKKVTNCVTFHFTESVNMSFSRGVSDYFLILNTCLCSHIPIYYRYA
mgnify:CR=1 FL=1